MSRPDPGLSGDGGASAALAAYVCVKITLAVVAGPGLFPDSGSYLHMSDSIVDGDLLTAPLDLTDGMPVSATRTIGYPLVLAAARAVAGDAQLLAIVALQSAGSCWTFWLGFRLQHHIIGRTWAAIAYTVFATVSAFALYDLAILADSVSATLMTAVVFGLAGVALGIWRIGLVTVALMGLAWGLAVIIRPPNLYFVAIPVLGIGLLAWLGSWQARRAAVATALLLTAAAVPVQAHIAWNEWRSGERFLSTLGAANWLWPVFNVRATGLADPFSGSDRLDELGRATDNNTYEAQAQVLRGLQDDGRTTAAIGSLAWDKMVATIGSHPAAFVVSVVNNFDVPNSASVLFNPRQNLRRFIVLGPLRDAVPHPRGSRAAKRAAIEAPSFATVADVTVLFAARAVAIALFLGFLVGAPVLTIRPMIARRRPDSAALVLGYFWISYGIVAGAYALIHLEERMLLPVILPAIITGLAVADRLRGAIGGRRRAAAAG